MCLFSSNTMFNITRFISSQNLQFSPNPFKQSILISQYHLAWPVHLTKRKLVAMKNKLSINNKKEKIGAEADGTKSEQKTANCQAVPNACASLTIMHQHKYYPTHSIHKNKTIFYYFSTFSSQNPSYQPTNNSNRTHLMPPFLCHSLREIPTVSPLLYHTHSHTIIIIYLSLKSQL